MVKIAPYLIGGLTAFLVADFVPVPSPSEQLYALRAGNASPAPLLGTPGSSVNRAAKNDREFFRYNRLHNLNLVASDRHPRDNGVVRTVPHDVMNAPATDPKPVRPRMRKPLVGCESSFSAVAAPSLAHHIGRCMADLDANRNGVRPVG